MVKVLMKFESKDCEHIPHTVHLTLSAPHNVHLSSYIYKLVMQFLPC